MHETTDPADPAGPDAVADVVDAAGQLPQTPSEDAAARATPPARPSGRRGRAVMPSVGSAPVRTVPERPALPARKAPRPAVRAGLPITAYGDDELDEMAAWILSDGVPRTERQLDEALRAELGLIRRGARVDAAVAGAVRRALA